MPVCAPTRSPPGRALHSARWHGRTPGGKLYIWSSVTCPSERARSANLGRAWRVLFWRFDWPCLSTPRPSYIPCLDATFGFRTEPLYYIHPSNVLLQDSHLCHQMSSKKICTCVTKCGRAHSHTGRERRGDQGRQHGSQEARVVVPLAAMAKCACHTIARLHATAPSRH